MEVGDAENVTTGTGIGLGFAPDAFKTMESI
jgi:hypothetical protein